ncbi:Bug family tripartite tricarboxylate transporter substrate binding protein [Roseinatronobacter alkalisoli]|uniref:Tripartite tricarboxylate transporter substrate binding protein n=1 Tax=Roseinatronobacter alkalisoli TaxID=3028235 RepID=A0ABT5TEJ5_9RHOB|nr:tripartite tricarboxylate transporter substrate binding protein [Roseinatronobacter sp. HJB301]MDD7973523.1 tripartite tricarboxylate transporter substrate binding protein [Roseinatronobacter sp. HJB301]
MSFKFFTTLKFAAVLSAALPGLAAAQEYPTRPVNVIVPFGAGGSTDILARAFAREMEDVMDVSMPVQNIGGAAGTIGTARLTRSRPDGYTVGFIPAPPLVNQPHMNETPYTYEDVVGICQVWSSPMALAISENSLFATLTDIVTYAKEHPGELSYGSPGPGSQPNLAMEAFLQEADIEVKHVPMGDDPSGIKALMGGHIDFFMAVIPVVAKNDLNAVALFADERLESLPDLPTTVEQGFETTAAWWGGVFAPKDIPSEARDTLEQACKTVTETPRFIETMGNLSTDVAFRNGSDLADQMAAESDTSKELIATVLNR